MKFLSLRRGSVIAILSMALFSQVQAQNRAWPDKPINLIVPSAAGGAADFTARTLANFLGKALPGAVVTVDNRAGAGGILGTLTAKAARPDGYSFLISTNSTHAANVSLYRELKYDPQKDFDPVGMIGTFGAVLIVPNNSPYPSLPQLIQYAKANPGKLNFGYYSSSSQVPAELLKARSQIDYVGITYKNITQIITDLIGGQLSFAFIDTLSAAPALQNDRLVPIAVTTPKRLPSLPNVPAVAETIPGFEVQGWIGLHAPAGTPKDVVHRMNKLMEQATADPTVKQALESRGLEVTTMSADQLRTFVAEDITRWARWVKLAGIQPQ